MAILALIAIWFVISAFVGVLLGVVIHHMSDDDTLPNGGRKRNALPRGAAAQ